MLLLVPINISTQRWKMIEPDMTNIYWTKIKLRAAANQAIYLMIFHWVVSRKFISEMVY